MKLHVFCGCLALLALASGQELARADDHVYCAMFACQDKTQGTQSFVLFFKVSALQKAGGSDRLENQVITWLSAASDTEKGRTRPARPSDVMEVLRWAHSVQARISMWGPFPVKQEVYEQSRKSSGTFVIPVAGGDDAAGGTANLLANAADLENDRKSRITDEAQFLLVLRRLEPWFLPRGKAPDWIRERLDLDKYGVIIRDIDK